jgi:hypothetical protein
MEKDRIIKLIRERKIDRLLLLDYDEKEDQETLTKLCGIYGISFAYPKVLPSLRDISRKDTFIGDLLVVETSTVSISLWERILKRFLDILIS